MEAQAAQKRHKPVVNPVKRSRNQLNEGQSIGVQSILHDGRVQQKPRVGQLNDKHEKEAGRVAEQVIESTPIDRVFQLPLQRKCTACEDEEQSVQTKLAIGPTNDTYEHEADTVADRVLSMNTSVGNISRLNTSGQAANRKAQSSAEDNSTRNKTEGSSGSSDISFYVSSLNGRGQRLSAAENTFFSSRFGRSFDDVRVHTGSEASHAASGIKAKAFTYGNNIVFNRNAYQPNNHQGLHLLAHELTHVVQQSDGQHNVNRSVDSNSHAIQRTEEGDLTPEIVGQDPDLLLCFILCELGVPPAIWRDITGQVLQAVWEEYRGTYSRAQASVAFQRFQLAFKAYSPIRVAKFVLTFIVQGKLGLIPIRTAGARALQRSLEARLIARGATSAGIIAAEQIARKVALVIEIAIAAGCAAYCGTLAYARTLLVLADMTAQGIVTFAEGLETAGEIIGSIAGGLATELIVRPIFYSLALLDVYNWNLSGMPSTTRADTLVIGWFLSTQINGTDMDTLLTQLSRPINSYSQDFQDLVFMTMNTIAEERQELDEEPLPYTARQMLRESPVQFIRLLNDEGYLLFNQDPEEVADAMISGDQGVDEGEE